MKILISLVFSPPKSSQSAVYFVARPKLRFSFCVLEVEEVPGHPCDLVLEAGLVLFRIVLADVEEKEIFVLSNNTGIQNALSKQFYESRDNVHFSYFPLKVDYNYVFYSTTGLTWL